MSYYNRITHTELKELPTTIGLKKGLVPERDTDIYTDAGWLIAPIVSFTVPEGHVLIAGTRRIEVTDNVPYELWDTETAEEAERKRIEALIPEYGQLIGQLVQLLAVFYLYMPITQAEASSAIYAQVKADVTKTADSQMTMLVYSKLRESLSDDDIYAISKAIGVAE
jgi:hypothetical protein